MFESFRDWDLKDTGSCDELGASAPVVPSKGDHSGKFDRRCKNKNIHNEKASKTCEIRCRGVGQ